MVLVNCKWEQEAIINGVEAIEIERNKVYSHIKTEGIRMYFDSKIEGEVTFFDEYKLIMKVIMEVPRSSTFAISILPVINGSAIEGYKYSVGGHKK
ncbi:hypothetical protein [Clostridium sp.]|uniref:hypothetical protein n=1 Tax=Clostridium sp. TaxID=1506 RepID=UPI001D8F0DE8|nr:hypothetical protein [Clostridium sp.]MBS5938619.1 hypothetical protein [Clostridium sp.]